MTENVILVDENDTPIGEMEKMKVHKEAKLHRAVSAFIFNSENKLLLQKRALCKYHSPGLWTNTACTHPYPEETNQEAVIRRLKQEMGLNLREVKKLFHFIYKEKLDQDLTEHEFDHVYIGISDELPIPNPSEVSDFRYSDIHQVVRQVESSPEEFTVWFRKIVAKVAKYLPQEIQE